jgi:hypothetical protein
MRAVTPVTFISPDGVERQVRFTLGARKRIHALYGTSDIARALDQQGDAAAVGMLHACMYDEKGNPPEVSLSELEESLTGDSAVEIISTLMSAATQGRTPKNEIEAVLLKAMGLETQTGSTSGASVDTASDSPTPTSGTDSSNANYTLSLIDTTSGSDPASITPD